MAHQSHNISYSKYLNCLQTTVNEELNGTNHKHDFKEVDILAYELVQVLREFSGTIKSKINNSIPYTEKEYIAKVGTNENFKDICTTDCFFEHLCNAIYANDPRLFATILKYMKRNNDKISNYNFGHPGYGQAFLGGLCQIYVNFLKAYLMINTLINAGYKFNEFWFFFKNTSKCNKLYNEFGWAFEWSCNSISDNFQYKHRNIYSKMPSVYKHHVNESELNVYKDGLKNLYLPENISFEELRVISKEMFEIMYKTYAILTIDEENEKEVIEIITQLIKELFT